MSPDTRNAPPHSGRSVTRPPSPRGRRIVPALVPAGELTAVLDAAVVDTALPSIRADTGASAAGLQWIHAAYGLTLASG
ncbi:hypothetical protein [Streptomyces sp. NPDC058623]|uniref:hypothetical protein n=1 Tax=Streptomyces sp. NPDC058623 TaxID=3346563 RepID=UPI003662B3CD